MTLQATEKECAAVAVAPRVKLSDIEDAIWSKYEFTADKAVSSMFPTYPHAEPLKLLSICICVLGNGFTVIGKSAPASPENFNVDLGRKLAYEDAIRQLWPLMGFALREKLSVQG